MSSSLHHANELKRIAVEALKIIERYDTSLHKAYFKALQDLGLKPSKLSYNFLYDLVMNYYKVQYAFMERRGRPGRPKEIVEMYESGVYLNVAMPKSPLKRLSVEASFPYWLVLRLSKHLSFDVLEPMLKALNQRRVWLLCLTKPEKVVERLADEGVEARVDGDLNYMVEVVKSNKPPSRLGPVRDRLAIPVDKASSLVVEALRAQGYEVLDACAAPGIKSSLLILRGSPLVIAIDKSKTRIKEAVKLLNLFGVRDKVLLVLADSRKPPIARSFAKALLDVPCSGTGTIGDDPSVKIRLSKPNKIKMYHKIQVKLLNSISRIADEILYASCSILPDEGELVVDECDIDVEKLEVSSMSDCYQGFKCSGKARRTLPHIHKCSAFFIALCRGKTR
ncbi:MAG: RsmB/NOP family class I SAM-dependent RNA methyltransferase [Candidatus Nezhaarchaeota archaeon]|nr:RsmB/NOP family class I SAM-dependent RNA methyltransferase [Candidatus Nezhaarchaeota archaeon]MCX8141534.1 RsmB/NOP family class I SAM-dependent RNA methyltransferase [Candidatus Nezhaarchaeota archaeon]MDW8049801.1 RsmB/NOP family class I SAM-dependent RNA methyltransferase [Nitrososphaerota archaeon]